ncbi:tellurite resistance TerB family protein [Shewanella xiamenensis]|uniref:tellurite resistance TerB family protein n=1 Tax=Shewanella xiamenensis TaxID=332186 RepID=UPI002949E15A|nr:TerB N-terminal domain-containing protein [Shewanella xiamenensis]MDV5246764.1 TerB N-terminal domain-containing protein [Shewanella xiamenensis]MDV5247255.1 TerB N-terminal domain-containing protein [Shewanella xiamenensis]
MADLIVIAILIAFGYLTLKATSSALKKDSPNSSATRIENNLTKGDYGLVDIPIVSGQPNTPVVKPIEVPKQISQHSDDYANQKFATPYETINPDNNRSHIKELFRNTDSAVTYINVDVARGDDGLVEIPIMSEESAAFDVVETSNNRNQTTATQVSSQPDSFFVKHLQVPIQDSKHVVDLPINAEHPESNQDFSRKEAYANLLAMTRSVLDQKSKSLVVKPLQVPTQDSKHVVDLPINAEHPSSNQDFSRKEAYANLLAMTRSVLDQKSKSLVVKPLQVPTQDSKHAVDLPINAEHPTSNQDFSRKEAYANLLAMTRSVLHQKSDSLVEKKSTLPITTKTDAPFPKTLSSDKPVISIPSNKSVWVSVHDHVRSGGLEIKGGFFYFGHKLKSIDGYTTESSLVDPSLPTKDMPMSYQDESLGYWPTYSSISPKCRGAYLKWLASDRTNPNVPLGYVFIYLYGLERRVVVDNLESNISGQVSKCEANELVQIFHEVFRLRDIYGSNSSFYRYSTNLLELVCIFASRQGKALDLEIEDSIISYLFRYKVALEAYNDRPLSSSLAFSWINNHPEYRLKTPARRCFPLFKKLFFLKYQQQFGEGIKITPNKTPLKITPVMASKSLRGIQSIKFDLPDAAILSGPFKKLLAIAEICNQELEPYSRYLSKAGSEEDDIVGLLLLPDLLYENVQLEPVIKLKDWLVDHSVRNSNVAIAALWQQIGLSIPAKFNKGENDLIVRLMDKLGIGFAPDPRFHHSKIQSEDVITVYSFESPESRLKTASKAFNELLLLLKLGAIIASADGSVGDDERELLLSLLKKDPFISEAERKSLEAFIHWQLVTPPNLSAIKGKLENVSQTEKTAICNVMVSLVLADGKVEAKEIKQLESIYSALGLDKSTVSSDIHRVATSKAGITQASNKHEVELDDAVLMLHESETKDVQAMLHAIFAEDEAATNEVQTVVATNVDDDLTPAAPMSLLKPQYRELVEKLLERPEWLRKDFKALCDSYSLMVNDVVEVVNDWAYDLVSAPLLEEDHDFKVEQEIADEINQLGK